MSQVQGVLYTDASNLCSLLKRSIILLHAVHWFPGGSTNAVARHVSIVKLPVLVKDNWMI